MQTFFAFQLALSGIIFVTISMLPTARAEMPMDIAVPDETPVVRVHAEGAQIYECKLDDHGQTVWQFREPIAALLINGKTIGRHYAGPSWELIDGSAVTAKVIGRSAGATTKDIPLLKLEVTSQRGVGRLTDVTQIQRLNTVGGALEGACSSPGVLRSVPYAADYAFFRPLD